MRESAIYPKKILFVTPPYHCGVTEVAGRWIPLSFVYLAGAARQAGLGAEIYDAMSKDHGYAEMEGRFRASAPDYVASTAITSSITDAIRTLEMAKAVNPAVITILGGSHPTFMYEEVLKSSQAVDYIVCGEGEVTLSELLTALEAGDDPAIVPGIAFRRGEQIVKTAKRCLMGSIDDLPAAWGLLDWDDYTYFVMPGSRLGAIGTSRGCNHDCAFCSQQRLWERSWRARDPQKVAEEVEHLHATYGVNVFLITDEYPTKDRERWESFLDLMIARGLPISFLMETRIPDILRDRDIMWKYRKAGVIHICIGVESADQEALRLIGKDSNVEEAKQAIDSIREQGIVAEASFILGFPDETKKSVEQTVKLAQSLNLDNVQFLAFTPWPYADLYETVRQYIRVYDYSKYNLVDPIVEPANMSMLQIDVAIADCYRKFYMGRMIDVMTMKDEFKRSYLMRAMKLFLGSPFILKKLGIGTIGKASAKIGEMVKKAVV